ncbi:MAG: glucokinase [Myxococcota bacterium]|jgi:glucokinase
MHAARLTYARARSEHVVVVGVDIGGSGLRAAAFSGGKVTDVLEDVGAPQTVKTLVERVSRLVARLGSCALVGVGVPGFVRDGYVLGSPNLPFLSGVDLCGRLRERLGVPVALLNDANAAAYGAWVASEDRSDLLVLTLGTGVGGGIILGGRPFQGASGTGAELGHIHIGGDIPCGCGAVGCLETWVGTAGLRRQAERLGHSIDNVLELVQRADGGEVWAQHLLLGASRALGQGLRTLLNTLGVQRVLITGGVAGAEAWLRPGAEQVLARYGIPSNTEFVRMEWRASAASWAIAGAAAHAQTVAYDPTTSSSG